MHSRALPSGAADLQVPDQGRRGEDTDHEEP